MNITLLNHTDESPVQNALSPRRPIPLIIIITLCGTLAIVGNGLVLIVLAKYPNLLESTRKFCMHLAVTDLGNGFLSLIFTYIVVTSGRNVDSCRYVLLLLKFFVFVSQAILTVNTFERYVGICKRQAYVRIMKKSTVNILLFLAWFYPVVLISASVIGFCPAFNHSQCYYHLVFRKWVYITEGACMFSAAFTNIVLFGFIIVKARTFYKRISPASLCGTSNAAVRNRGMEKSIRNGKMMGIVTAAFLFCWIPFNVYQTYVGFGGSVSDGLVIAANTMYSFGLINSMINPFIYAWQKKEFRDRCKKLLKCKQSQVTVMNVRSSQNRDRDTFPSTSITREFIMSGRIETCQQTFRQPRGIETPLNNEEDITTIKID
ncbi:hypothetical protein FSP39_016431 [Pinctada imbricata]|uniref:G-protein coupled receptors family 1 profile domain-containing protein n=1 Tax=Pinctada imbricata TaxID=66713 RepID=A0AA88XVY7_PINIB|nr:hypothetical protein FSP39_016431 [Pinctada imbricata]